MTNVLNDLYDYISEHTPEIHNDQEYTQALLEYRTLEEEVKEKIGNELLYKYQCAEAAVSRRWDAAVLAQTLRFMLEILR